MKIKFISVGKIKEKYYTEAIQKNIKEIRKYAEVEVIELPDEKCPEKLSEKEMIQVKDKEGQRILGKIDKEDYVMALAIEGKEITSEQFRKELKKANKTVCFIIGGSLGLSTEILSRANYKLSFSRMTFPHQLMKVILTEQVLNVIKRI